jgi:hypothetical protein
LGKTWKQKPSLHNAHPIEYKGIQYPTLQAVCVKFGLHASTVLGRLEKGQPLEYKRLPTELKCKVAPQPGKK